MRPPSLSTPLLFVVALVAIAGVDTASSGQELEEAPPFVPPTADAVETLPPGATASDPESPRSAESSILMTDEELAAAPEESAGPPQLVEPESPLLRTLREGHAWARFEPGAWRRVRVLSEAYDAEGAFAGRSLTERTERLVAVEGASYELSIETSVELAGRRTTGPREERRLAVVTDRPPGDDPAAAVEAGPASISLGDLIAPCRVWRRERSTADGADVEQFYVTNEPRAGLPRLLRRERTLTSGDGLTTQQEVGVTHTGSPAEYGGALVATWHTSATLTQPTGARSERFAVHAAEAPGGLLHEAVTEYDAAGGRSRWAVTELVQSGRTASERIDTKPGQNADPVEIRPRRLLRMLRRGEAIESL